MTHKKSKETVYKHAELALDPIFDIKSALAGFSVNIDTPLLDHELFKKYFRTDFLVIFLITKGEVTFTIDLKKIVANKNTLLVAAPNAVKQLVNINKECIYSGISFTAGFLGQIGIPQNTIELLDYFTTKFSPSWELSDEDASLIKTLMNQLAHRNEGLEKHPYGKELLYHAFNTFLYEMAALSTKYANLVNARLSRKENLVMNFTSLVQRQFRSQRNVQQYAKQLYISPKYLTETVKEIAGKNAGEIIDDFVVLEARLLLDNPSLSIAQVAEELNFSNQSFFGKFFKRHTGLSPKEYRNAL